MTPSFLTRRTYRLLVLDGHSYAARAFVRSLGRNGCWVAVGSTEGVLSPASVSRYCSHAWQYPSPLKGVARFIESLHRFVDQQSVDMILPMTDATTWPLAHHREQLENRTRLALPTLEWLELTADKHRTARLAIQLGIPIPETVLARSTDDLAACAEWNFPVVVKDRYSMRWIGDTGLHGSVSYAFSPDELRDKVLDRVDQAGDVLLQRFIPGTGIGFSCLAADGRLYLPFQWERIREKDPRGSGSSARKSVPLSDALVRYASKLLQATSWGGISMLEFKRSCEGEFVLMEINGRPWGSMQLAIASGIDYPVHWVEWLLEHHRPAMSSGYKVGITCRTLVGDLVHLENLRVGRPDGWPVPYPNFYLSLLKVALPWYPGLRYEDLWFTDPHPGLLEFQDWLRMHLKGSGA